MQIATSWVVVRRMVSAKRFRPDVFLPRNCFRVTDAVRWRFAAGDNEKRNSLPKLIDAFNACTCGNFWVLTTFKRKSYEISVKIWAELYALSRCGFMNTISLDTDVSSLSASHKKLTA